MRPNHFTNRITFSELSATNDGKFKHGLFLTIRVDYNHQQKLPLEFGPVRGGDGSVLPSEAAMKSSRNSQPSAPRRPDVPSQHPGEGETRAQRLERIRREIQDGTYETPEKLDAAIERMLGILSD